jgi:polyhydroxyalkanoate synthesis regulator phasin
MDTSNEIIHHAKKLIDDLDKACKKKTKTEAGKIDRCVKEVEDDESVDNPWAVCTASVMGKSNKDIYNEDIEAETLKNDNFRIFRI